MESGQGSYGRVEPGEVASPHTVSGAGSRALLGWGPILVLVFVAEGMLNHCRLPGLRIPFVPHMIVTAGLLALLAFAVQFQSPPRESEGTAYGRIGTVKVIVLNLAAWGFVSCLVQEEVLGNLAFWAVWAANLYVMWWSVPRLLGRLDAEQRINLVTYVMVTCVVASVPAHLVLGGWRGHRLAGIFGGPTTAGRVFALTWVLLTIRWITEAKPSRWLPVAAIVTAALLVMTRTRGSIAAGIAGCGVVVWASVFSRSEPSKVGRRKALFILQILAVALAFVLVPDFFSQEEVVRHLRIEGGWQKVYQARAMNWERGYAEFPSYGFLGRGFLSKFGNPIGEVTILGLTVPRYDWTTVADPLNMFTLMSQQIGFPGGLLLLALVVAIYRARAGLPPALRLVAVGFLCTGLVLGVLDGNWLTSFGDPVDRLCFVTFAAMLTAERPAATSDGEDMALVSSGPAR